MTVHNTCYQCRRQQGSRSSSSVNEASKRVSFSW